MTAEEIKIGLRQMMAIADAVKEAGRIGEGVIYAAVMDQITLPAFDSLIRQILATKIIRRENHELIWVG